LQQKKNGDGGSGQAQQQTDQGQETPEVIVLDETTKGTKLASSSKGRSLAASKFLLEPIPKGEEAARILEIAEKRKTLDVLKPWDESITKRAMNPAIREVGYFPATTEASLADEELNEQIQRETLEAEKEAVRHSYQKVGRMDAELVGGFGTMTRNKIEDIKGTKDEGRINKNHPNLHKFRHPRHNWLFGRGGDDDDSDKDSAELALENTVMCNGYESTIEQAKDNEARLELAKQVAEQETRASKEHAEAIIETTEADDEATADPRKFPRADKPGPVNVEKPIIDNEVDDFVTEQLYIHSKLMIVDDRIIICGSANINDRSQLGYRDSEIAMIIEDTEMIPSRMNGQPYKVGRLAHTLRADLFKEHLGLLPHVDHDVVTKASVLPVDLDKPNKDPEEARLELIRKAQEEEEQDQQLLLQQQKRPQLDQIQEQPDPEGSETAALVGNRDHGHNKHGHRRRFSEGVGHLEVFTPNAEETDEINQWHSPNAKASSKKRAADDPAAADEIVMDPLHDDFYEGWWKRVAVTNTEIFREVFRCVPDDTVETWDEYRNFVPNPKKTLTGHVAMEDATVDQVKERLQKVTGHLVEFPTQFLRRENLLGGTVETTVVPMDIFT
ncbi:hypothetical protein BGZ65_008544, partial [Modicella reniformis]